MSEETEILSTEVEPENTATAAGETVETNTPEQTEEEKKFSQAELDALIGKRLAREQRKWEREQAQRAAEQAAHRIPNVNEIDPSQFNSNDEYVDALAEAKAAKLLEQREQKRQQTEFLETYHEKEEEARSKYDDFEQVAYNPKLPITDVMAQSIQSAENGPDIAYHLGLNPKEADRIARLSPVLQAKEIGRIEAKLSAEPPKAKQTTRAPAPINPLNPKASNTPSYDTTDPRSVKQMSTSEWIEAERQRQIKKWESSRRR